MYTHKLTTKKHPTTSLHKFKPTFIKNKENTIQYFLYFEEKGLIFLKLFI